MRHRHGAATAGRACHRVLSHNQGFETPFGSTAWSTSHVTESTEASIPLTGQDQWSRWLLRERFGGSEDLRDRFLAYLSPVRDRVLDGASIGPGQTVLDVGCGDGLLGLAALDRVGPTGQVVFSDVSAALLDHCRSLTAAAGAQSRSRFVPAALPKLAGLPDGAVDAVVLRSVLLYVGDKADSLRHLHRVLRPGGRLSLFEPINFFAAPEPPGWLWGFDLTGLEAAAASVHAAYAAHTGGNSDPMLGFDERDLLDWAHQAGFDDLHLTYEAHVDTRHPAAGADLQSLLSRSPNPLVPTLGQLLAEALTDTDRAAVEHRLTQALTTGRGRTRQAVAYLTGRT